MLTIENYKRIQNEKVWTKSNTQEWIVARIDENKYNYQITVLPKDDDSGIFVLSKAIVYTLQRVSDTPDGYKLLNTKNNRLALVRRDNLEFGNFILELMIQTSLNTIQ